MKHLCSSAIPGVEIFQIKSIPSEDGNFAKPFTTDVLRGFIEKGFGEVYSIIFPPGSSRGGHHHKKSTEFFSVIQGSAKLFLDTGNSTEEIIMNGGQPVTIKIPPGVKHTIQNIGNDYVVLIVYWNKSYSQDDNDTFE